jgi:predicted nucleic acid-binding Zn ribbon protein
MVGHAVVMSDGYQGRARRIGMVGSLAGALVVLAVFLMVTKPGG